MSLHWKINDMPMKSEYRQNHTPRVLFKTSYGVVSIIDPNSIKRFQQKSGCIVNGKIDHQTKAEMRRSLLDPSDIGALDKAIPIRRTKLSSSNSINEDTDLVECLIKE